MRFFILILSICACSTGRVAQNEVKFAAEFKVSAKLPTPIQLEKVDKDETESDEQITANEFELEFEKLEKEKQNFNKPVSKREKKFQRWIKKGIKQSRDGRIILIADKRVHIMDLYINGELIASYPVEIGMDTREEGGWHPTPIGKFDLQIKSNTRFYKALLYKLPGYYLIHGSGSGMGLNGADWTFGCIALSNDQIDDLFERIGIEKKGELLSSKRVYQILRRAKLIIVPFGLRIHN